MGQQRKKFNVKDFPPDLSSLLNVKPGDGSRQGPIYSIPVMNKDGSITSESISERLVPLIPRSAMLKPVESDPLAMRLLEQRHYYIGFVPPDYSTDEFDETDLWFDAESMAVRYLHKITKSEKVGTDRLAPDLPVEGYPYTWRIDCSLPRIVYDTEEAKFVYVMTLGGKSAYDILMAEMKDT